MTQKPAETIARLLELDAKRHTGRVLVTEPPHNQYPAKHYVQLFYASTKELHDADRHYCEISDAIPAIRQLLATIAVMGEALGYIRTAHGEQLEDAWECVDKALAAYEPFKALAEKAGV